jgi:hypothetical protein
MIPAGVSFLDGEGNRHSAADTAGRSCDALDTDDDEDGWLDASEIECGSSTYVGCYATSVASLAAVSDAIQLISTGADDRVSECAAACAGKPFMGLQGSSCSCFSDEGYPDGMAAADKDSCGLDTEGNLLLEVYSADETCAVVDCSLGYTAGDETNPSTSCPDGCTLVPASGEQGESCTATVDDCTTDYTPGTASAPSSSCPAGCLFAPAIDFDLELLANIDSTILDPIWNQMVPFVRRDDISAAIDYSAAGSTASWSLGFDLEDNFVMRWQGYISVASDGDYDFEIASDDGTLLYIDGLLAANYDGLHGASDPVSATVTLSAGEHSIMLAFFEAGGAATVRLQWTPAPGDDLTPMAAGGAGAYTHNSVAVYSLTHYSTKDAAAWSSASLYTMPADLDNDGQCDVVDTDDDDDAVPDIEDEYPRVNYATTDSCAILDHTTDNPASASVVGGNVATIDAAVLTGTFDSDLPLQGGANFKATLADDTATARTAGGFTTTLQGCSDIHFRQTDAEQQVMQNDRQINADVGTDYQGCPAGFLLGITEITVGGSSAGVSVNVGDM